MLTLFWVLGQTNFLRDIAFLIKNYFSIFRSYTLKSKYFPTNFEMCRIYYILKRQHFPLISIEHNIFRTSL